MDGHERGEPEENDYISRIVRLLESGTRAAGVTREEYLRRHEPGQFPHISSCELDAFTETDDGQATLRAAFAPRRCRRRWGGYPPRHDAKAEFKDIGAMIDPGDRVLFYELKYHRPMASGKTHRVGAEGVVVSATVDRRRVDVGIVEHGSRRGHTGRCAHESHEPARMGKGQLFIRVDW